MTEQNKEIKYLNYRIVDDLEKLVNDSEICIETKKHYLIQCKYCIEELKYFEPKLYILKDYSIGFCQRCNTKYFNHNEDKLNYVIDDEKIPTFKNINNEVTKVDSINPGFYNHSELYSTEGLNYLNFRYSIQKFDSDIKKILNSKINYVKPKYNLSDYADKIGIRYRDGCVIVPFYWDNKIIYYQVRFINPENRAKYFMPPIDHKPIYQSPFNNKDNNIGIICEGVYGSIAISFMTEFKYNVYAVQGSYITDYQINLLESLGLSKLYLYFDETSINYNNLYGLLKRNKLRYNNTLLINSLYGDPELDYLSGFTPNIDKDLSRKFFGFKILK